MTTSFSEAINYCRHVFNEKILKLLEVLVVYPSYSMENTYFTILKWFTLNM